jgi:hypothetical protein
VGKSDMKTIPVLCPHCGKDITEYVNRVTAGRAARASLLTRPKGYYSELSKKRWTKKNGAEDKKDTDTRGKDGTPPSTPQNDALRRT